MHDDIKRFHLTGTITSDKFVSARESMIKDVEDGMRDEGFVPVLDLLPQFTRNYNAEEANFTFTISIYGVYVGEERAWLIAGMNSGLEVQRYTHPTK